MGTVNSNFLPATTGLNLGSLIQRWNGFYQNLTVSGTFTSPGFGFSPVSFSATPVFSGSQAGVFEITLTGNVTSSSFSGFVPGVVYTFIIIQDITGHRTFAWPAAFKGAMLIDPGPSITSVQQFVFDGTNAFAISAGVSM